MSIPPLQLGNLNSKRDWGYAPDYMEGVYLMMAAQVPKNYVLATGEAHSVKEFFQLAYFYVTGADVKWIGEGLSEQGRDDASGRVLVEVNPRYYRPIDINCLVGDASKAKAELGWSPRTSFKELVKKMMYEAVSRELKSLTMMINGNPLLERITDRYNQSSYS